PAVRAGALLREARVVRKAGHAEPARGLYLKLAAIPHVNVAGAPAELIARLALGDGQDVRDGLLNGRWHLTRGQFEYYWAQTANSTGKNDPPPADGMALAAAAAFAWEQRNAASPARGEQTVWIADRPFFVLWRGAAERRAVLITAPGAFLKRALAGQEVSYA